MKKYILNLEKTYGTYATVRDIVLDNYCYNNCANVLINKHLFQFILGKYRIGYCYVGGEHVHFYRHCIIIDSENEILDYSIPIKYKSIKEAKLNLKHINYYIFKELKLSEYQSLSKEYFNSDFRHLFCEEERDVYFHIKNKGYKFNINDYNLYIKRLLKP